MFKYIAIILITVSLFCSCAQQKETTSAIPVILDTDVGNDIDDVLAMQMLLNYEKKEKIDKKLNRLAQKIIKKEGHVTPSFKTKAFFYLMHFAQRNGLNEADASYWQQKGWTKKVCPWK